MGESKNKFSLSRNIPAEIARQLRQEAGFGCVICGCSLITYEHIINFSDVDQHRVEDMAVLCENCHGKVTRKQLSKEYVRQKKGNPKALEDGFAHDIFFATSEQPTVTIGNFTMRNIGIHLMVGSDPIIHIKGPSVEGEPALLNLMLADESGFKIVEIVDNQWRVNRDNWDVETNANRMTFRKRKGCITLEIEFQAPDTFRITRLNMLHKGRRIYFDRKGLHLRNNEGGSINLSGRGRAEYCSIGILM